MPATTKVPLGPATKVRKWFLDVNVGTFAAPVWVGVFGITDFKGAVDPATQDDSDFDSDGWKSEAVTALGWGVELKVNRKSRASDATQYDPGQEVLRLASLQMGTANTVDIRYYEMEPGGPRIEAYRGFVGVAWSPEGGGMEDLDAVSVKLSGQGKRSAIAHPDTVGATAPTITSLAPSTAAVAGGTLIVITGTGFATTTDVTVGGVSVPVADWEVITDSKIALKAPAHAAGSVSVVVVNPGGSSAASPLTYS